MDHISYEKFELFLDVNLGGECYSYKLTNSIDIDKFLKYISH